jgi:hypothetical protein
MKSHTVVSPAEWLVARRALPWERVDKKGRDEDELPRTMAWLRRRDEH